MLKAVFLFAFIIFCPILFRLGNAEEVWTCQYDHTLQQNITVNVTVPYFAVENPIVINVGPCGCPNFCYESIERGVCVNDQCECNPGWSGPDCSSVDCSSKKPNNCSGNGVCLTESNTCQCTPGFFGRDCSQRAVELAPMVQTQKGNIYTKKDKYGNNHPIFNQSTIAQIDLSMDFEDFVFWNTISTGASSNYSTGVMTFDNGIIKQTMPVQFRLKGATSRLLVKKGWKIKWADSWFKTKTFAIRAAVGDVGFTREILSQALYNSVVSPTYRTSLAELRINGVYMGLYVMVEDINNDFLDARFGNHDGALYKVHQPNDAPPDWNNVSCEATNDAAENYTLLSELSPLIVGGYNESDWSSRLDYLFDIRSLLKVIVVDSISASWDGFIAGNNFYLYYDTSQYKFVVIRHDFDTSFGDVAVTNKDIYFRGGSLSWRLSYLEMVTTLLNETQYRSQYTQMYCSLMTKYFNPESPFVTYAQQLYDMALQPGLMDLYHQYFNKPWSVEQFEGSFNGSLRPTTVSIMNFLNDRFEYILQTAELPCYNQTSTTGPEIVSSDDDDDDAEQVTPKHIAVFAGGLTAGVVTAVIALAIIFKIRSRANARTLGDFQNLESLKQLIKRSEEEEEATPTRESLRLQFSNVQ